MTSESLALCNFLKQRGYTAFFVGDRCGIELYNHRLKNKLPLSEVIIMSNIPKKEVDVLFSNSVKLCDPNDSIMVKFAGKTLQLILYNDDVGERLFNMDFTLDVIIKNESDYVNYVYTVDGNQCTAIDDVRNKVIRIMRNNSNHVINYPKRILRAFELMATFGFNIECDTLELLIKQPFLLAKINRHNFKSVMHKIIVQQYSYETFNLMIKLGLFNYRIGRVNISIFNDFNFERLINISKLPTSDLGYIERWALLIYTFNDRNERLNYLFHVLKFFTTEEFVQLRWLINNINLVNDSTLNDKIELNRNLYKASKGLKLMELRNLTIKLCNMYQYYFNRKDKSDALKFSLCSRPYFLEQLDDLTPYIVNLTDINDSEFNLCCKRKLLNKLIQVKLYPRGEEYDSLVNKVIIHQSRLYEKNKYKAND